MSAEIIDLKAKRHPGNGARDVLIDVISSIVSSQPDPADQIIITAWAERVLMELWVRNFKIVPFE